MRSESSELELAQPVEQLPVRWPWASSVLFSVAAAMAAGPQSARFLVRPPVLRLVKPISVT